MKARVIGTTEWVTDFEEVYDDRNNLVALAIPEKNVRPGESLRRWHKYPIHQIEFFQYPQWHIYRMECAKEFVNSILSNPAWFERFNGHSKDAQFDAAYYKESVVGNALSYADYLIEKLSKGEQR